MTTVNDPLLVIADVQRKIASKEFQSLKDAINALPAAALAADWGRLGPFEKIVLFKLLAPARAQDLLDAMSPAERGFLLGAREPGVLGPVTEDMPPAEAAALFHHLSDEEFARLAARVRSCI